MSKTTEEQGAAKRAARWLYEVVGEGQIFTKAQLRAEFPGVEQIDRRTRGLRKVGWVFDTYREDPTLAPEQSRLVKIGEHAWLPGFVWPDKGVSGRRAREVFDRDSNRCVVCGIAAGEPYPEAPDVFARLTIGHLVPKGRRGSSDLRNLRTECARCNEASRHLTAAPIDPDLLLARIRELSRADRAKILDWVEQGHRNFSPAEILWSQFRQLPGVQRDELVAKLAQGKA